MRAAINLLGFFVLSSIVFGLLFKIQHWPGGSLILTYGFTAFSLGLIPVFFSKRLKNSESDIERASNITGLIAMLMTSLGILFKFQHWPGAAIMLSFGAVVLLSAIVLYVIFHFKFPEKSNLEIGKAAILGVFASIFLMLYSVAPTADLIISYRKLDKSQQESSNIYKSIIDKQITLNNDVPIKNIATKCDEACTYILECKTDMIICGDGQEGEYSPEDKAKDVNLVENAFDLDASGIVMIEEFGPRNGKKLKNKIAELKDQLLAAIKAHPSPEQVAVETKINQILYTGWVVSHGQMRDWEIALFESTPLAGALASLSAIDNEIRTAQFLTNTYLIEQAK